MKTHRIAAFVTAIVLVTAVVAVAQQATQNPNRNPVSSPPVTSDANQNVDANRNTTINRSDENDTTAAKPGITKLDDKTTGPTVRASQLIGANIKNSNDESVGENKDLVLDTSGKVRYAAVTYGGFLGINSKMFAVPFEAFHVRTNDSKLSTSNYVLTLDVTKEQLQGDQGFDNDHWPDFADTKFTQDLARRYKVDHSTTNR